MSRSNAPQVKEYVACRQEHRRRLTFQHEFRSLPRQHGIEFDERYVPD